MEKKNYPLRSEPVVPLYTDTVGRFLSQVETRFFFRHISRVYSLYFGQKLTVLTEMEWKYSIETLAGLLKDAGADSDAGIRVYLVRNASDVFLSVMLVAGDEKGRASIAVVDMLAWDDFRQSEKKGLVEYKAIGSDFPGKAVHPSLIALSLVSFLSRGCFNPEHFIFLPCVFFLDAAKNTGNDITLDYDSDGFADYEPAPLFYSDNRDALIGYIKPAVTGSGGYDFIRKLSEFNKAAVQDSGTDMEAKYYSCLIRGCCDEKKPFVMTITGRFCNIDEEIIRTFTGSFRKPDFDISVVRSADNPAVSCGGAGLVFHVNYVPAKTDCLKVPYNVVITDPFTMSKADFDTLATLKEEVTAAGCEYYSCLYGNAFGFSDSGAGNGWLIRHFGLGMVEYQRWRPEFYKIEIADGEYNPENKNGIADVEVPDDFSYNAGTDTVESSPESKILLYRRISAGAKGVRLYIRDLNLRRHIAAKLNDSGTRYSWIDNLAASCGGDIDRILEAQKDLLQNTVVQNKYEGLIADSLGQTAWEKISPDSRKWLVSAVLSFNDMKEYDSLMDFSGVTLMISKVFECELRKRISDSYVGYLKKKYGSNCLRYLPANLTKYEGGRLVQRNPGLISLGDIPYVMGLDSSGDVYDRKDFENFSQFARDVLFRDTRNIYGTCRQIVEIEDYVRKRYRNVSAHSGSVDIILATECVSYCITDKHMLGVLLDKFRF